MDFFKHNKVYDFIKYSNFGLAVSGILLILIFIFIFTKGINLGVDFAGGNIVQILYLDGKEAPISKIRDILNKSDDFRDTQITEFGSKNEVIIKFRLKSENVNISDLIISKLSNTGNFEIRRVDVIGPKAGSELVKKGITALSLAIIAIMIYVSFRYEWRFALAGILALIHDVIISGASIILFNIDLSLDVLAALLTLIGYSINDTIIIFDRIREQMLSRKFDDVRFVINEAVSATLSRTFLTSLTVFFVIFVLFIFGSDMLKGFTTPMLVGSIVGTYSSMFIAPKLAVLLGFNIQEYYKKENIKQKKRQEKERLRKMYEQGRV